MIFFKSDDADPRGVPPKINVSAKNNAPWYIRLRSIQTAHGDTRPSGVALQTPRHVSEHIIEMFPCRISIVLLMVHIDPPPKVFKPGPS